MFKNITNAIKLLGLNTREIKWMTEEASSNFGILSAYKNYLTKSQNKKNNEDLIKYVNDLGYSWEEIGGVYGGEVPGQYKIEHGIIIYNIDGESLEEIAAIYDQDAIIFKSQDSPVELRNIKVRTRSTLMEYTVDTDVPRPRVKKEMGIPQEDLTRVRDIEIKYKWSDPIAY